MKISGISKICFVKKSIDEIGEGKSWSRTTAWAADGGD